MIALIYAIANWNGEGYAGFGSYDQVGRNFYLTLSRESYSRGSVSKERNNFRECPTRKTHPLQPVES